jgi:hypothetical protein
MVDFIREVDFLGFDEYPDPVEDMLAQHDWDDPLNRLRVGVVLSFSLYENRNERYVGYNVDKLENGSTVFLIRPAWLNKGYDFKACVDGWDDSQNPAPSHDQIYSDIYWKREHDDEDSFEALCEAVLEIHAGVSPNVVLDEYGAEFDFTIGRTPDALLKPLPWLFMEQDIRYWNYDGRNETIKQIENIYQGESVDEMGLDPQPLEEIHDTALAIPNQ